MKIICRYMMLSLLLAVHFVTSLGANAQSANGIHTSLPVLTTALVVHSLPPEQAARSYPVHLRAVVTYYDPDTTPTIALSLRAIPLAAYVSKLPSPIKTLHAGMLIDLEGVSAPGDFARRHSFPQVKEIAESQLPAEAPRVTYGMLESGAEDAQFVEAEGVVHSVTAVEGSTELKLAMPEGTVTVEVPGNLTSGALRLVDAKVLVRGNAVLKLNALHQMVARHSLQPKSFRNQGRGAGARRSICHARRFYRRRDPVHPGTTIASQGACPRHGNLPVARLIVVYSGRPLYTMRANR